MMSDQDGPVDRRTVLKGLSALAASAAWPSHAAEPSERISGMGVVIYDFNLLRRSLQKQDPPQNLFDPLTFLKHCHSLGAGGIQANLGIMQPAAIKPLREFAERHDLFIDAIIGPPKDRGDVERFAAEIQTARDVGVQAVRTTIIPGRRYERFKTLAEFREFERRGETMLELAVPVLEKHRIGLAVENHKDQRIDERIPLLERLSSEFIGACIDTGNSIALLDDPYETVEARAFCVDGASEGSVIGNGRRGVPVGRRPARSRQPGSEADGPVNPDGETEYPICTGADHPRRLASAVPDRKLLGDDPGCSGATTGHDLATGPPERDRGSRGKYLVGPTAD